MDHITIQARTMEVTVATITITTAHLPTMDHTQETHTIPPLSPAILGANTTATRVAVTDQILTATITMGTLNISIASMDTIATTAAPNLTPTILNQTTKAQVLTVAKVVAAVAVAAAVKGHKLVHISTIITTATMMMTMAQPMWVMQAVIRLPTIMTAAVTVAHQAPVVLVLIHHPPLKR